MECNLPLALLEVRSSDLPLALLEVMSFLSPPATRRP